MREAPTFHQFASSWLEQREPELRPKTVTSYRWQLRTHLLPHFARLRVDIRSARRTSIAIKAAKLREGALGPNQINKSLGLLAMILDAASDYGHIDAVRNPARGRRRRVKGTTPSRPTVKPEQLPSLLEAAGHLRPILTTMAGAGLRNGEACALNRHDFDAASGTLTVAAAKTDVDVPEPQWAAAERQQRRETPEDRDPSRQYAARRAGHPPD
ncbi:MAG TPA: hypothetical protein VNO20_06020 [Solirubrobacterales bacterium]|nr:hypothetical protein [Solirubrobacterales bacterium]